MNKCPMCGSEIPEGQYVCPNCGGVYSSEFFSDPNYSKSLIVNNPIWGEIGVDFSKFEGNKLELLKDFEGFWSYNESNPVTRLALFPGQFQKISSSAEKVTLYAPDDLYKSVEGFFSKALTQGLALHYKRLTLDEIQNQQKLYAKFK